MEQKKGLILNKFDGHSIVDALNDAFEIKKEDTNQPYQFLESSKSLVIKQEVVEDEQEENKTIEEDTLLMLEKLIR